MIYTFYSYKGGVGRSMAMANVAQCLYMQGKKVIMIDWDLEAPGLESYFFQEEQLGQIRSKPGIMDMLSDYKTRYNKLNKEIIRASQEIEAASRRLMDRLMQSQINWTLVEKNFNTYAAFTKTEIADVIKQLTKLNEKEEISISEIAKVIEQHLTDGELADVFSIHISDKLQNGKLDIEEVEVYLSTYSLFSKNDLPAITNKLKILVEKENLSNDNVLSLLSEYVSRDNAQTGMPGFLDAMNNFNDMLIEIHPPELRKNNGLWLLSAGRRDGDNFTTYSKTVQDFNWTEFYLMYQGEKYFEWFRTHLESMADIILIDSRTGVSEMSGVSTRHLADVIVVVTAPNPQNLAGMSNMIKSFIHKDVQEVRGNRSLKVVIVPSRIDFNENQLRNQFQAKFYRMSDEVLGNSMSKEFWELGIPYIPFYNYNEELAVGLSDNPDELEISSQSRELDRAYRKLASYLLNGTFEISQLTFEKPTQPFIGLRPFQVENASLFFGRNYEISRMYDILHSRRFLILSGPAGSGKSSVLRAGLIPALKENTLSSQPGGPPVLFFRPGADPFSSLAEAIAGDIKTEDQDAAMIKDKVNKLVRHFTAMPEKFTDNIRDTFNVEKPYVIIIDQFEEIFTVCNEEHKRESFINALCIWAAKKEAMVAIALRADFLGQLFSYPSIAEQGNESTLPLKMPGERELKQIILEPATKAGVRLEQGLVERILKDIESVNNKLPLLQTVLYELWLNRSGNILTHAAYDKIGRVDGILKQMFESTYKQLDPAEVKAARSLITRLVNVTTETRQKLNLADIDPDKRVLLKPFIDKGLLIIDKDPQNNTETVELAHDVLITSWPQLREWVSKDYKFLLWRQKLNGKIENWKFANRTNEFLLNSASNFEASKWLADYAEELSQDEINFVKRSSVFRKRQRQRMISLFLIIPLSLIIFIFAYVNKQNRVSSVTPTTDSVAIKAYQFTRDYYENNSPDLAFNLGMLKRFYAFDREVRDTLEGIRKGIEGIIVKPFTQVADSFYLSLRNRTFDAGDFFTDTVIAFGSLKKISSADIQTRVDAFSKRVIRNKAIDSTYLFKTDSLGFYLIFREAGNVLLDKLQEFGQVENIVTMMFTENLGINSFTYRAIKATGTSTTIMLPAKAVRADLFICDELSKEYYLKEIIETLEEEKFSVRRKSFQNPADPASPYYVRGNEIRYFGADEYRIAVSLRDAFLKKNKIEFSVKPVRISTPGSISVFVCQVSDKMPGVKR